MTKEVLRKLSGDLTENTEENTSFDWSGQGESNPTVASLEG
jgi:hypothetical protein